MSSIYMNKRKNTKTVGPIRTKLAVLIYRIVAGRGDVIKKKRCPRLVLSLLCGDRNNDNPRSSKRVDITVV